MLNHFSCVPLFMTPVHQAPLSMGFSRQEHEWVAMAFSQPRKSYQPRYRTCISCLQHWQVGSLPLVPPGRIRLPSSSPSPGVCSNLSIELVMPSSHLICCPPLLLLPSLFASIKVFSKTLALCIRGQSIGTSASVSVFPMNLQD